MKKKQSSHKRVLRLATETLRMITGGDPPPNVVVDKDTVMVFSGCIPCSGGSPTERCN